MIRTIDGIARIIGVKGLSELCSAICSYGEKYKNKTLYDIYYLLESYREIEYVIDYFNNNRLYCESEFYNKGKVKYVPFYKTKDFVDQCNSLNKDGFFATDFI